MRMNEIANEAQAEFIPKKRECNHACKLAQQLVQVARYSPGHHPKEVRELAHKLADRFHSDVLAAIDDELNFSQIKSFDGRA